MDARWGTKLSGCRPYQVPTTLHQATRVSITAASGGRLSFCIVVIVRKRGKGIKSRTALGVAGRPAFLDTEDSVRIRVRSTELRAPFSAWLLGFSRSTGAWPGASSFRLNKLAVELAVGQAALQGGKGTEDKRHIQRRWGRPPCPAVVLFNSSDRSALRGGRSACPSRRTRLHIAIHGCPDTFTRIQGN